MQTNSFAENREFGLVGIGDSVDCFFDELGIFTAVDNGIVGGTEEKNREDFG